MLSIKQRTTQVAKTNASRQHYSQLASGLLQAKMLSIMKRTTQVAQANASQQYNSWMFDRIL
jgi:hypothetical protein